MNKGTSNLLSPWRILALATVAVTATTARADYQSTVLADHPLAFYALNPGSDPAGVSPDLSGNGNDGMAYNLVPATGPSSFITNAAAFDGADTVVLLGNGANPGLLNFSGPITLEAWIQPASPSAYGGSIGDIVAKGYDSSMNYNEIFLRVNSANGDGTVYTYAGGPGTGGVSGGMITTNWVHLVLSSDGTNTALYVDGVLVQKQPNTTGAVNFNDPFNIGTGSADGTSRWFNGNISEVAIYNHGLSAAQVLSHYNMGMFGATNAPAGNSLRWSGTSNSGVWDEATSANWININSGLPVDFTNNDQVLFDDTTGAPTTVSITGAVVPSAITVTANANNYTINGSGNLYTSGSFTKNGSSTVTLNVQAFMSGPVAINGGTVVAGYYAFANAASITVTNNATLDFGGSTMANNTPVTISGTGVGGEGALYNGGYEVYNQVFNITLAGDATIGGSSRWDLVAGSAINGPHKLTVNRTSGVYGEWAGVNLGSSLGDVEIAGGKTGIKNMGSTFGNPAATFIIDAGGELDFWSGDIGYAKNFHVLNGGLMQILSGFTNFEGNITLEDGAQFNSYYGSGANQILSGTVTLNGNAHIVIGDANFVFQNPIGGPGGFVMDAYNHALIFQAANTYTGPTAIASGPQINLTGNGSISQSSVIFFGGNSGTSVHIDASGRSDSTLTLASGQTLGGIGAVAGNLVVSAGATISPAGTNTTDGITTGANVTGPLTATGNITLNGATILKLSGSGTNDVIGAGGNLTLGGSLTVVNAGVPLAAGNTFLLFTANGTISGGFGGAITLPALGAGLSWDTTQLSSGRITVVGSSPGPVIGPVTISGGNVLFSGTGGAAGASYSVIASTNLLTPVGLWTTVGSGNFDNTGKFTVSIPVTAGAPQQFFRIK